MCTVMGENYASNFVTAIQTEFNSFITVLNNDIIVELSDSACGTETSRRITINVFKESILCILWVQLKVVTP